MSPYAGLSPFIRAEVTKDIEQCWAAEKDARKMASLDSIDLPSSLIGYLKAWKKALRNASSRRLEAYVEDAFQEWAIAVGSCSDALRLLGPVYAGVEEFDKLPDLRMTHLRKTKGDIVSAVLQDFKNNPDKYEATPDVARHSVPNLLEILNKMKGK